MLQVIQPILRQKLLVSIATRQHCFSKKMREKITAKLEEETSFLDGEVEVDESYFGETRKEKRDRGAAGKVSVFGLLKRGKFIHNDRIPA